MKRSIQPLTQCRGGIYNRKQFNHQRGSVLVEFVFCFPVFILICLFLFEVCLISVDKHIVRLATYEAARVYAAAEPVDFDAGGAAQSDPCKSPAAKKQARFAATKKLASVAPQIDLLAAKAIPAAAGILGEVSKSLDDVVPGFAKRLALRWFSASFLTEIECQYDAPNNLINVEVKYSRVLETPVVNKMIYLIGKLFKDEADSSREIDFDPMIAKTKVLLTDQSSQSAIRGQLPGLSQSSGQETALKALESLMNDGTLQESLPFINILPSVDPSREIKSSIAKLLQVARLASVLIDIEPEFYWRLPLHSKVSLTREFQTKQLQFSGGSAQGQPWKGNMTGTMSFDGAYRDWAHALSNPSKYLDHRNSKVK